MSTHPIFPSLHIDRDRILRPDLIPLAAFLCSAEYTDDARTIILAHAAGGAPLAILTATTPDGAVILEPSDLEAAEAALARGRGFADAGKGGMA
jgi:hypothetical protein